ncbi:MAG: AIR synthase related protein [Bacteroidota bacterium]
MSDKSRYDMRGVSASKQEVHDAIKGLDKGLYPKAFCKILPDFAANDPEYCNLMHADTAGTKTSLAYLYWKETGDLSVWKGIAQDAIVMNLDDMACVGSTSNILLSSTIGRNKNLIPGQVIKTLIHSTVEFCENLKQYGIEIHLAGGETADVGDIVRTLDVGFTAFARLKRSDLIVNDIQPGAVIVGFASHGQASYESEYNGGMGSNGLTSARHDTFDHQYANQYPDSFDPNTPLDYIYTGSKKLTETIHIDGQGIPYGKLVLSPTRTYLPVIQEILKLDRSAIQGMIHCTGGAQTKVMKFVEGVHVIKDNLFDVPPLFDTIRQESKTDWKEMYQVFNMGHRLEVYCDPSIAQALVAIGQQFNIDAQVIGRVEASAQNTLTIESEWSGVLAY